MPNWFHHDRAIWCWVVAIFLSAFPALGHNTNSTAEWWQWRGPLANGVGPEADPPVFWSETNNVRWKAALPGKGHSTPIVVRDRVFVTLAVPVGEAQKPVYDQAPGSHDNVPVSQRHQFIVMALSRLDGKVLWKKMVHEEFPHEGGHETGSLASNSPVSDGTNVYVSFGSRGLYCFDLNGNLVWKKDLGRMQTLHAHGEGSSPVVHEDYLIVVWDHESDSFLHAFDKNSGKERWKITRDEKTSWSTPLMVQSDGRWQIVVSATSRVRGHDLLTGKVVWECTGLSRNVVSSPVAGHGMVFAGNSYDWQAMLAIRVAGAKGDISGTPHVVWKLNRLTPYVSSPLLYGDTLYFVRHNQNVLSRMEAVSGKFLGEPLRLEGIRDFIFSSPVGASGRVYVTARDGTTVVLRHDLENSSMAVNRLDDVFSASPALAGLEIYLRGEKFLYCLAGK